MPDDLQTKPRAKLIEVEFRKNDSFKKEGGQEVEVQFNPQTLQVKYKNQKSGGDQQANSGVQFVGKGSTSLSVDLLFDVTRPEQEESDVRHLTKKVNHFMRDLERKKSGKYIPPGVRFVWGSFLFEGVMDSMSETLEFFDPEGRPLRATVSISMSQGGIQFKRHDPSANGNSGSNGDSSAGGGNTGGGGSGTTSSGGGTSAADRGSGAPSSAGNATGGMSTTGTGGRGGMSTVAGAGSAPSGGENGLNGAAGGEPRAEASPEAAERSNGVPEGDGTASPERRRRRPETKTVTSVQQEAAKRGNHERWKETAEKNGVENPRAIENGRVLSS